MRKGWSEFCRRLGPCSKVTVFPPGKGDLHHTVVIDKPGGTKVTISVPVQDDLFDEYFERRILEELSDWDIWGLF